MKTAAIPFCTPLYAWNGTGSIFYSSHVTPLHYHNTLQLIFDLKGKFLFRTENSDWTPHKNLIIKENVTHQLNTNNSLQLIIYLEPGSLAAKKISDKYLSEADVSEIQITFSPLEEILFHQNLVKPHKKSLQLLIELIIDKVTGISEEVVPDERMEKVLSLIKQTNVADLSIDYLAAKVFISPSRLRMQFKALTGISLHNFIIRHKLLSAITEIANGSSIQDAAYRAGFNDSSHLNKLMLKTFAINPSNFLKDNKSFYVIDEDSSFRLKTSSARAV